MYIYIFIYVIYKPRLVGVFHKYMTRVRSQRKFATDKPQARSGKLPLTSGLGHIFVEYIVLAVVHMIYAMETSH